MSRQWQPKHACRCPECGWKSERTKAMAHKPCPACGHYPVRMDARPLKERKDDPPPPKKVRARAGRIEAQGPFAGWWIYPYANAKRDGGRLYFNLFNPVTRQRKQMTPMRYAACIRFGRELASSYVVMPRDGDRTNARPENTLIVPASKIARVNAILAPRPIRECVWCEKAFRPINPRRETCSEFCRKAVRAAAEGDRRYERKQQGRQPSLEQGHPALCAEGHRAG